MSSNSTTAASGGAGFTTLLLLVFVCAKIFGVEPVASWSWWWVMAPFWIPLVIVLFVVIPIVIYATGGK